MGTLSRAGVAEHWRHDPGIHATTRQGLENMLIALAQHGIIKTACKRGGISTETYRTYWHQYEDFRREVLEAVEQAKANLETTGMACALMARQDPRYQNTLMFALRAKCGWQDGPQRLEHSGPGGGPIPVAAAIVFKEASDDELRARLAALRVKDTAPVVHGAGEQTEGISKAGEGTSSGNGHNGNGHHDEKLHNDPA